MIIEAFNLTWFIELFIQIFLIVLVTYIFRNKSYEQKRKFMIWFSVLLFVYLLLYRYALYIDPDYEFIFWDNIPLQPCNFVCILAMFAAISDKDLLKGFCFYVGIAAPLLALCMPETGFHDIPVFCIRSIGYYGFHWMVIVEAILFASLGLFKPDYKKIPKIVLFFAFLLIPMHLFNLLLRATVYPEASYFYTCGNDDNFVLKALKELIPINVVYELPLLIVVGPIFAGITAISRIFRKKK